MHALIHYSSNGEWVTYATVPPAGGGLIDVNLPVMVKFKNRAFQSTNFSFIYKGNPEIKRFHPTELLNA